MTRSRRLPDLASAGALCAAVATTALLTWPLLSRRGYPLARDLVFTPDLPLRPEGLGVSTSAPRAVPLDAAVAVLDSLIGGEVLARVAVVGGLLAAGVAAGRACRTLSTPARVFCVVFAVWNPFVIERLALGQWALLLGYAGVWGIVALALTPGKHPSGWAVGPWLALGALTPTGALLVGGASLALFARARDVWLVRILVLIAQLPWLVPSLIGGAASVSDPDAVDAFAARAERSGGAVWTLIGLGGIWDRLSVPASRVGWLGHATSAIVVVVLLGVVVHGWRTRRSLPRQWDALGLLAVMGLTLAALSSSVWGSRLVELLVATVPGAGLLRDSQKWLTWFVVAAVLSATWVVHHALAWVTRHVPVLSTAATALAVVLPVVLLPDATQVVWRTVTPVNYPRDFGEVASRVVGQQPTMITLPWRAYRRFTWGNAAATYDPASRWFDIAVVGSDELSVGTTALDGEDVRARRVGEVLDQEPSTWATDLVALGVGYVLVHQDDPEAIDDIPGAQRTFSGDALTLWRLDATPAVVQASRRGAVLLIGGLDLCVVAVLLGGSAWRHRRRVGRKPSLPATLQ